MIEHGGKIREWTGVFLRFLAMYISRLTCHWLGYGMKQ